MANPENMFKMMLDEIHEGTAPLKTVVQNQEIIIAQNQKLIELLGCINQKLTVAEKAEE